MRLPTAIKAQLHPDAIRRIPRMFNSSLRDVATEMLQNARRAGATHVDVVIRQADDQRLHITIRDNGCGIADPGLILSFGENGWPEDTTLKEDAAGMGFASLATRNLRVMSRPRDPDRQGWQTRLQPDHFLGGVEAAVEPLGPDDGPLTHGTWITLECRDSARMAALAFTDAAMYYPLPVSLSTPEQNVPELPRRQFLGAARHTVPYHGVNIGVIARDYRGTHGPAINFHGHLVEAHVPEYRTLDNRTWYALFDVQETTHLELVLPNRYALIENDFLKQLLERARKAIFEAMAMDPDPQPTYAQHQEARALGIELREPPRKLVPWRPHNADFHTQMAGGAAKAEAIDPARTIVMRADLDAPQSQVLARALAACPEPPHLLKADGRLDGFAWISELPAVTAIAFEVTRDGVTTDIMEDDPFDGVRAARVDTIDVVLSLTDGTIRRLPTDFAVVNLEDVYDAEEVPLVLTRGTALSARELADLIEKGYFCASDDTDADSWDTQQRDFRTTALDVATEALHGAEQALRERIVHAAAEYLSYLVPRNHKAVITITPGDVQLDLEELPETPETRRPSSDTPPATTHCR